ncbi:SigE family RNA polymerase sigma factor [Catellatospora sp. NPDC049609]|uniref:SigE family RNA polymerase sigma factor n=1 Tax=Catellatospora sp. NPDC049609 TaxID=3155505 RepID=UPI00342CFDB1
MAETATFDEFVMVRSRHLLRIAYLLTGDHALAEDLLQTALAKSWSAWARIDGNPEPYVRTVLANTYNSWWRRRWNGERPTGQLPEWAVPSPQAAIDERDQVWRALSRLPRQQRLVLVLRYLEDLSEAEIARTLGISAGSVKTHASKGLAKLRLDPSLRSLPLPDDEAPAGNERLVAVHHRIAGRRRRRIAGIAAACLAALALIAAYALVPQLGRNALPEPAFPVEVPRYVHGQPTTPGGGDTYYRVVASAQHGYADHVPAALTWTPGTQPQTVYIGCRHKTFLPLTVQIWVNGHRAALATCMHDDNIGVSASRVGLDPAMLGLVAGHPATMTVDLAPARPENALAGEPLPAGTLTLAIADSITFAEFPLPTPPATLPPLSDPLLNMKPAGVTVLTARGAHSATLTWHGTIELRAEAQTPGRLRIAVDGVPLRELDWWTYQTDGAMTYSGSLDSEQTYLGGYRFKPGPGATITITVESERMTGDWWMTLRPAGR